MNSISHPLHLTDFVTINRQPDCILIRWRWITRSYMLSAVFMVFILFVIASIFIDAIREQGGWGWFMLVFFTPWILYVLYYLLTKLLNSSYILVNKDFIEIVHKPLPMEANVRIPTQNLSHLHLEQKRYQGKSRRRYFELNAFSNDGKIQRLLRYIEIEAQAVSIKREIENFMNSCRRT